MATLSKQIQKLILDNVLEMGLYESQFEKADKVMGVFAKKKMFAQSCFNNAKIKRNKGERTSKGNKSSAGN